MDGGTFPTEFGDDESLKFTSSREVTVKYCTGLDTAPKDGVFDGIMRYTNR